MNTDEGAGGCSRAQTWPGRSASGGCQPPSPSRGVPARPGSSSTSS